MRYPSSHPSTRLYSSRSPRWQAMRIFSVLKGVHCVVRIFQHFEEREWWAPSVQVQTKAMQAILIISKKNADNFTGPLQCCTALVQSSSPASWQSGMYWGQGLPFRFFSESRQLPETKFCLKFRRNLLIPNEKRIQIQKTKFRWIPTEISVISTEIRWFSTENDVNCDFSTISEVKWKTFEYQLCSVFRDLQLLFYGLFHLSNGLKVI